MTRANSIADLRKRSTGDWTVVDADAARPPIALAPAEIAAALGMTGAGVEMALEQGHPLDGAYGGIVSQSIVLPVPPSANRYWRSYNGTVVVSAEAQDYKAGVQLLAQYARLQPFAGEVAMYVHVYRVQRRGDLDNFAKVLGDALNGVMYHDDSQVVELHMWRHDDKAQPRVEVECRRVGV